ncbi:MAG: efflux RND transporter periplasmic adaptor subunit [Deltaproteobacteria bacterium]|nr:efflux RND transporter periplasmic adaptor subunit [Deltaproteobacteria bacterium]
MRTKQLFFAFLLTASGIAGYWWWSTQKKEQPVTYMTTVIERGSIARTVVATGTVNPVTTVQVGTYVSGPIREIFADFNSAVKKGQRVAQIDPRPFLVKVKQAEANLTTARAQVEKDRADLTFKQRSLKRTRELFERNLIAKQEVEAAERDVEQAQAQYELDQARVEQTAAALEEARVNLGYTDIVSPVDGVVVSRNVNVGQTVAASFQTPVLFQIAQDLTKMQVNTNVSESDIGVVAEAQHAFFLVDAYPERKFWGAIMQVRNAPQIVQNVVTYDVVVAVENADLALKPGMTASLSIITAQREDVVKIPQAALRFSPPTQKRDGESSQDGANGARPSGQGKRERAPKDTPQVWVQAAEQKLTPVAVQIGISDETFAELIEGNLKAGDVVVTGVQTAGKGTPQTTLPGFGMRWRR